MIRLAVAGLVTLALASVAWGGPAAKPKIHPECVRAADHARPLFFRTADGIRLAGVMLGRGTAGVTLAHQSRGDLCDWLPFARTLAASGYRVLAFDFRGYGESQTARNVDFPLDVAAAARALRAAGAKAVVPIGASMGGTATLVASASMRPAPAGAVSLSGPAEFGSMDAKAAVARSTVPLLLVAAKGDTDFAPDQPLLARVARTSDKQVAIVAGYDHGIDLLSGSARKRVTSLVLSFLRRHRG